MFHGKCENCGIGIQHEKALKLGGSYWITTSGKWFCSNRCKDQFVFRKNTNNQFAGENIRVITNEDENNSNENDAELQRLRLEREREEENIRMLKGQRLRDKGRPVAAWLTELDPVYASLIILGILVSFFMGGLFPIAGTIALIILLFLLIREAVKKA